MQVKISNSSVSRTRIALFVLLVILVFVLIYPYVVDEMTKVGSANIFEYYVQKSVDIFGGFKFNWYFVLSGLAVTALGLGFEILLLGWRRSSLRRLIKCEDRSSVNDLFYWLIGIFRVGFLISFILTLGVATVIFTLIGKLSPDIQLIHNIESPVLQYLAAFLAMDLMGYVQHRLAHQVDWWWELHKIHHSAEKLNMITFYRTHVLESIPRGVVYGIAIAIVGDWSIFIFYYSVLIFISMLVHSEIQYSWGWLEKYLLVSPRNHKIHHSINPEHHDKNFGFTLIIWDRIFGTWHEPTSGESVEIGLKNNPFNHSNPVSDLLLAYKNSVKALLKIKS